MSALIARDRWRLDRRLPVAFILAVLVQTAAFGFWAGGLVARVGQVEQWQAQNARVDARLAALETQTAEIARVLGRLENRMLAARAGTD